MSLKIGELIQTRRIFNILSEADALTEEASDILVELEDSLFNQVIEE